LINKNGEIDPISVKTRTETQTNKDYHDIASNTKKDQPFHGLLGVPVFRLLPYWSMRKCQSIDIMHNISGNVKKLIKIWSKPSNLGGLAAGNWEKFDKLLQQQKVTSNFHRKVRSAVEHGKYWKASESVVFLLYLTPLLESFMSREYYDHLLLLICSLRILLSKSINESDLAKVQHDLDLFVLQYATLYGERMCTANVHNLVHLVDNVRLQGPLWAYTCFVYEGYNHILLQGIHGSYMCQQGAVRSIAMYQMVKEREVKLEGHDKQIYNRIKDVAERGRYDRERRTKEGTVVQSSGSQAILLMDKVSQLLNSTCYRYIRIGSRVFEARGDTKSTVYNDSFAILKDSSKVIIRKITLDHQTGAVKVKTDQLGVDGSASVTRNIKIEDIKDQCIGLETSQGKWQLVTLLGTHKFLQ
ncbi:hypothetical protein AKO1_005034, partial [Acrasis kona]